VRPLPFHTARGDVDLNFQLASATKDAPPHLHVDIDIRHVDLHKLFSVPAMPQMVQKTAGMLGGFLSFRNDAVGPAAGEALPCETLRCRLLLHRRRLRFIAGAVATR
jgi:hypothetical protein